MDYGWFGAIFGAFILIGILILVAILAVFLVIGFFLNNYHKFLYGKGSACAWIPFAQGYLLGKLTFNKLIGWVVVGTTLLFGTTYSTTVNGETVSHSLFPGGSTLVFFAKLGLLIYAIIKYEKLKKGELNKEYEAEKCNLFWGEPNNVANTTQPISSQNPESVTTTANAIAYCPSCGSPVTPDSDFCVSCGSKLK